MGYTKDDLEFLWKEHDQLLKEIRDKSSSENMTKKDKILRYKELVIKLVDAGAIAIEDKTITRKDVTSYCYKKLIDDCGFTYDKKHFYELFEDDYKRNYSQSSLTLLSDHEHDFELVDILPEIGEIKKCQCGQMLINDKLVKLESQSDDEDESTPRSDTQTQTEKPIPRDELEELLLARGHNATLIAKIWSRSFAAAFSEEKVKAEFVKLFDESDVKELLKFEKTILAKLKVYDEETDKRERLHFAETMRLYMYNELYGLAKCGDILEYSSKWISIVARQEQNKKLTDQQKIQKIEEIKKHIADCPVCGWDGWASWYNEQQKRIEMGLEPEMPQKTDKYLSSQIMQQLDAVNSKNKIELTVSEKIKKTSF